MKQALRQHIAQTCTEQELKRWFDPLRLRLDSSADSSAKVLVISFPHAFFAEWFEREIQSKFEAELGQFLGNGSTVRYENGTQGRKSVPLTVFNASSRVDFPFDRQFTFDTFLVNKKNYFPLASAKEVAKQSGTMFNPFVICGRNGSGKSHLLRAIANEISKKVDAERILLTSMDELNTLLGAGFGGDMLQARNHVFGFDYLFVDDFQQIRKYPALQQEMVTIFNHFYDNKKQMGFSCLDKLSSYDFLDPTLLSRLEWGLIVTLKQPDLEIRVGYIQALCRSKKLTLTKEQILTLAQRFEDFRYLQGILLKLFAFRDLVRKDLGEKDFENILNNTEENSAESLNPKKIQAIVAERFDVSASELTGSKRHQRIAQARQVAMYLCRTLLGISYPALGRAFGGKDHSTVLYSVKKIEELRADDESMKRLLKDLKKKCLLSAQ